MTIIKVNYAKNEKYSKNEKDEKLTTVWFCQTKGFFIFWSHSTNYFLIVSPFPISYKLSNFGCSQLKFVNMYSAL